MKKGFTLIELVIVFGIFFGMAAAIAPISFDSYRSAIFLSETATLASLLQTARQQSIDNLNAAPHGIHFEDKAAILFEGSSYSKSSVKNKYISFSSSILLIPQKDILFSQLSATSSDNVFVHIMNHQRQATITVETSGRIDF